MMRLRMEQIESIANNHEAGPEPVGRVDKGVG